jgi:hypothetical protein
MLKPLLLFGLVRGVTALGIGLLLPLHDGRPFGAGFTDLNLYNGSGGQPGPLWTLPNPLYAALVRGLGYGQGGIQDGRFIALSLLLSVCFTAVFVVVSSRVHRPRQSLLYAAALGAHPYLALYSLKLDTSLFALLPVGLLTAGALMPAAPKGTLLVGAVSSLLRNALLPMLWLQAAWNRRAWHSAAGGIGLAVLAASSALQLGYGANYVGQNYGCYSLERVSQWLAGQGLPSAAASAAGLVLTPVIHLLLDLGAREAVANHCLLLPAAMAKQAWLHLGGTAFFVLLHGWLLWQLVVFVARNHCDQPGMVQLLFPLGMLLPTFYGAAHMRYLIPIIPLLLLMAIRWKISDSFETLALGERRGG